MSIDASRVYSSEMPYKIVNGVKHICPASFKLCFIQQVGCELMYDLVRIQEKPVHGQPRHHYEKRFHFISTTTGQVVEGLEFKLSDAAKKGNEIFTSEELETLKSFVQHHSNIRRTGNSVYCMEKGFGGKHEWQIQSKFVFKKPTREVKSAEPDGSRSVWSTLEGSKKHVNTDSIPRDPNAVLDKRSCTSVLAHAIRTRHKDHEDFKKNALNGTGGFHLLLHENEHEAFYFEFTELASSKDSEICDRVLKKLKQLLPDDSSKEPINPELLEAIYDTLVHTNIEDYSSDDLIKLLNKLEGGLENIHLQNTKDLAKLNSVLTTLGKILDIMADANIEGIDYNNHNKLYKKLEEFEKNENLSIFIRAKACRAKEALLRLKHDKSEFRLAMSRLFSLTKGFTHIYHSVKDIKPGELVKARDAFKQAWQSQAKANDWYIALRYIEELVTTGNYENIDTELETILSKLDKKHHHLFVFCFISISSKTILHGKDEAIRARAISGLKNLYNYVKDDPKGPYQTLVSEFNDGQKKEMRVELLLLFQEFASPFVKDDRDVRQHAREHLISTLKTEAADVLKSAGMENWTKQTVENLPLFRTINTLSASSVLIDYIREHEMNTSEIIEAIRKLETSDTNIDLQKLLANYVTPRATDETGKPINIDTIFSDFLKGDFSLVIQGETGAGKSYLALKWYYHMWAMKLNPGDMLAAYVPFETLEDEPEDPVAQAYHNIKGSKQQCEKIARENSHFVACDSIEERRVLQNIFKVIQYDKLNKSKVVGFIRDQLIDISIPQNKAVFQKTDKGKIDRTSNVRVITLLKWGREHIKDAVQKNIDSQAWKTFPKGDLGEWNEASTWMAYIDLLGLEGMMYNPLMCSKVLQILPWHVKKHEDLKKAQETGGKKEVEVSIKLSVLDIYKECLEELHTRQVHKVLTQKGDKWSAETDLHEEWLTYDKEIAARKYLLGDHAIKHVPEVTNYDEDVTSIQKNNKYRPFFVKRGADAPVDISILRSGSLVQRVKKRKNEYEFLDISWEYYCLHLYMVANISDPDKNKAFYTKVVTNPILLNFLVLNYQSDANSEFRQQIDELAKSESDSIGKTNAQTIIDIATGKKTLPQIDVSAEPTIKVPDSPTGGPAQPNKVPDSPTGGLAQNNKVPDSPVSSKA